METFKTIDECFYLIQNGANIKQGQINGGYPITRIETISNDKFNRDKVGYAGIFELGKYASYVLEDGDLLMSHINSPQYLGRTVLYKKKDSEIIIHGMNLLRLKANVEIINPAFARYLFYSVPFRRQIAKITKKSVNQASFSINDLKKISIVIPSLSVQEKIVKKLNSAISVKNYYERQIELLDELVKARFVEMFGDPIYNTQNRPMTEFINVVKMQRGYDLPVQDRNHEGSIPVYGANGVLGYHDVAKINNGGIITGRSGTIGKVYLANKEYWPLNTSLFSIETYGNNLIYLQYLVTLYDLKRFVEGTGVPTLNRNMFHNKKIIEVPINEQNTFASFVEEVDKSRLLSNHSQFLIKSIIF